MSIADHRAPGRGGLKDALRGLAEPGDGPFEALDQVLAERRGSLPRGEALFP